MAKFGATLKYSFICALYELGLTKDAGKAEALARLISAKFRNKSLGE